MFALKFLTPLFGLYLWCVIGFWTSALKPAFVHAIATKSSPPVIVDNTSNSSQYVQIRLSVNQQPTRAFLVQQKSSLSPVQQTHILDDVQKNQRVHYQPSYSSGGGGAQTTSSIRDGNPFLPSNSFLPSHLGFESAVSNDYGNFNSLSPSQPQVPSLQTLVLSPQQTLPTSQSFANEYFPSPPHSVYRQPSATVVESSPNSSLSVSSASSSHRIPFSTAPAAVPVSNNIRQPSSTATENFFANRNKGVYPSPIRHLSTFNSTSGSVSTGSGSAVDQYPRYEPTLTAPSFLPTVSKTKPYHVAKDVTNGVVSQPQLQPPTVFENFKYVNREPTTISDKLIKEVYLKMNPEVLIAKDRQKFFQQLLESDKNSNVDDDFVLASDVNDNDGDTNDDGNGDQTVAQNNLGNIRNQFEKELFRQLKQAAGASAQVPFPSIVNNSGSAANGGISELRLSNGQKVQISKDYHRLLLEGDVNADSVVGGAPSASSNKIKAIVVKQFSSTTSAPSKTNLLEELTKGVVPVGAEFELIKRNKDGALEEVSKLPQNIPQKKVTFVILEEQPDGTVKVQGVRGSEKESLKESGEEVDTIIKKIEEGELKLPPSTRLSFKQSSSPPPSAKKHSKHGDEYETKSKRKSTAANGGAGEMKAALPLPPPFKRKEQQPITGLEQHFIPTPIVQAYTTPESLKTDSYASAATALDENYQYYSSPSTFYADTANYVGSTPSSKDDGSATATILNQLASAGGAGESWNQAIFNSALSDASAIPKINAFDNFGLFHLNNSGYIASLFSALKTQSQPPPMASSAAGDILQSPFLPTTLGHQNVHSSNVHDNSTLDATDTYETAEDAVNVSNNKKDNFYKKRDRNSIRKNVKKIPAKDTRKDNEEEESSVQETKTEDAMSTNENSSLSDVLKKEGFYAMARFLRQSGLGTILNDTGPFTLFIPTDKAFRTLLIQLGGPDKAEEKFKENPRLLSGLLLHHVIPGAFRVNSLQDEMTGVSLAGTQLRVNAYTTHDIEWNDITVVTVNGAKILDEKDIVIPQGIAHAVDRVMFPLPVGNLLQSLQADRENRYSNFLKILEESELLYLLTGGKTFTLFAPLNRAFTHAEFTKILADTNESKSFVLRHLVMGALYSAGMKYYQVRDSMEDGQQITLYKEAGKIKVNNAHVVTRNIPATNGVIHAIDAFL